MKRQIRQKTGRNQGKSVDTVIESLNAYIVGWVNYYALADALVHMRAVDEWLRRRLRQLRWKQWKTPKKRQEELKRLGVSDFWSIRAGGTSKGEWRLSASPALHRAMNNDYWRGSGLKSFLQQYQLRHT